MKQKKVEKIAKKITNKLFDVYQGMDCEHIYGVSYTRLSKDDVKGLIKRILFELDIAGVAQIESEKSGRAGSGPAPGDQKGKI